MLSLFGRFALIEVTVLREKIIKNANSSIQASIEVDREQG